MKAGLSWVGEAGLQGMGLTPGAEDYRQEGKERGGWLARSEKRVTCYLGSPEF